MKRFLFLLSSLFIIVLIGCNQNKSDRFVEIDGHKQHILDLGEGFPVVIFVTGAGVDLNDFNKVQSEIATLTRTLSYDRAGIGLSEELDAERTVDHFAIELHEILVKEKIDPPYLMVGHELGGFTVRWFAHAYPDQVAGMVLIDPSYEGFMDSLRNTRSAVQRRRMKDMVDLGIANKPKTTRKELELLKKDEELMRSTKLPGNIPITILTSARFSKTERDQGATPEDIEKWVNFHERLKLQAPQLKHRVTEKSGAFIHHDEPELVIAEIKIILEAVRQKKEFKNIETPKADTTVQSN
jgi:pimeloyl-ACP methyl ester carboxylesterase